MSRRDLTAKYGNKNVNNLINAAIRAEIPGGDEVLNAIGKIRPLANAPPFDRILALLRRIVDAMALEIRHRYGMLSDSDEPRDSDPVDDAPSVPPRQ
jgi:hypothetical protein